MNFKVIAGLLLGFGIGLGCSLLTIPVPAPPVLIGALLVVAMTLGFILTDKYLASKDEKNPSDKTGDPDPVV